jgi:hypothetical protein
MRIRAINLTKNAAVSVGGHAMFLQEAPTSEKSKVQLFTTLSVTEAALSSGTDCAQDMLFAMRIPESVLLKVKRPMMYIDNKEAMAGKEAHRWQKANDEEHERMMKHKVWQPVPAKRSAHGIENIDCYGS